MNTKNFNFTLEKYKGGQTRFVCPGCGHQGTFSRYINTATGEYLSTDCGRCNRELNCGYHKKPNEFLSIRQSQPHFQFTKKSVPNKCQEIVVRGITANNLIKKELFKNSLVDYERNKLIIYLSGLFGEQATKKIIEKYYIGTANHWDGATVFWQIDIEGRIRAGKIMLYDEETGKRIKEPQCCIIWVHAIHKVAGFELRQCFFGEHLLKKEPLKPIIIVESEKTAIIASAYFPRFLWLASGGLNNLTPERMSVLKGRTILLYPDSNGYEKWMARAKQMQPDLNIQVSELLERRSNKEEKIAGYDLADYLIKFPLPLMNLVDTEAILKENGKMEEITVTENPQKSTNNDVDHSDGYSRSTYYAKKAEDTKDWDERLLKVENFEDVAATRTTSLRLDKATIILDVSKFYPAHLAVVKENRGKTTFLPYLERLERVVELLASSAKPMTLDESSRIALL